MKFVKKLTALFLAVVMVMAMGITAFAEETTYQMTVKSGDSHTYSVYQIFKGDYSNGTLSNVTAGKNYKTNTSSTAAEDAETLSTWYANYKTENGKEPSNKEAMTEIEKYADLSGDAFGTVSATSSLSVPGGYYLVKDSAEVGDGDTYTFYIVKVAGAVEIARKAETPDFEKKVKDINDSTDTGYTGWQDAADYDIGDSVQFKLTGTVADDYDNYTVYKFIFHDKLESGKFDAYTATDKLADGTTVATGDVGKKYANVKVYLGDETTGTQLTGNYSVADGSESSDPCTFEVKLANLKNIANVTAGSTITVTFEAKLGEGATLGSTGNINQGKLEFSNNPNDKQGGETEETPWDNVIVFTYKVVVNKTDSENNALAGAAFKLEKEIKGVNGAENTWVTVKEFTAGETTSFTFSGLDDGNYRLTETTTPAGYNTIAPITFTVSPTHSIEWTTGNRTDILTDLNGTVTSGEITFTKNVSEGSLSTNVVNKKGAELPSTGGMGTTVIYIAGIAMIVAAGVVVIARKRMA